MTAVLQLEIRDNNGERHLHLDGDASAGRDAAAGVYLYDDLVSWQHGRFEWTADGWVYLDTGSRNGSFHNGNRLNSGQAVPLRAGDVLQLGSTTVRVAEIGDTARGGPRAPQPPPAAGPVPAARPAGPALDQGAGPGPRERPSPPASSPNSTPPALRRPAAAQPRPPVAAMGAEPGTYRQPPGAAVPPAPAGGAVRVLRAGRAIDNDFVLTDPFVSSYQVEFWAADGGLAVRDVGSRNGTFVEGQRIKEAVVPPRADIQLGPNPRVTLLAADVLSQLDAAPSPSLYSQRSSQLEYLLVGQGLGRIVGKNKFILRDVDLSLQRGQFTAIAGGSGAGKSTLMKVLNRYNAPDTGGLLVARNAQGEEEIGYVPQDDIIHRELPLRDAIVLSALLRYPPGTPKQIVERRADEVLTELGLREHAGTVVGRLSGGQRKRASVALELMRRPRLLLLDEPTSGLDPASDERLIRLLRALAESGIGILLISHIPDNIEACDTVAFLAPGGYLVFYGTPDEAKEYFDTPALKSVYAKLETEGQPDDWRRRFEQSEQYQRLRRRVDWGMHALAPVAEPAAPVRPPGLASWQLRGLARRYYRTLLGDRRNLALLLGQVPAILLLCYLIFRRDVLTATDGLNLLFIVSATLVWLGTINSAREICKELPIYQREQHVGIGPVPYVLSKVLVLGGLCLLQTLIMLAMLFGLWQVPGGVPALFGLLVVGFLAALSGVAVGLLISASVPMPDRATALVPLVMIPQIMFGGGLLALKDLGAGQVMSYVVSTRWAFQAAGVLTERTRYVPRVDPHYNQFTQSWALPAVALFGLSVVFTALAIGLVAFRSRRGGQRRPAPAGRAPVGRSSVAR